MKLGPMPIYIDGYAVQKFFWVEAQMQSENEPILTKNLF